MPILRSFLKLNGITLPENQKFVLGGIPVSGYEPHPIGNQCMLVGDAMGMPYPLSAGGIMNSISSALIGSKSLVGYFKGEQKAMEKYPKELKKAFKHFFWREHMARKLLFACTDEEMENLFKRTKKCECNRTQDHIKSRI